MLFKALLIQITVIVSPSFRGVLPPVICSMRHIYMCKPRFIRNYLANDICEFCPASKIKPEVIYSDMRANAGHRAPDMRVSHDQYVASVAGSRRASPWIRHLGWRLDRNLWDWMHLLLVKGVLSWFFACLLIFLCRLGVFGPPPFDIQLVVLRRRFKLFLKEHHVQMKLPRRLVAKGFPPCLHGEVKAYAVKLMVYWLCPIACGISRPDVPLSEDVAAASYAIWKVFHLLDPSGLILSQATADSAAMYGRIFLTTYSHKLGAYSTSVGLDMWTMKPKFHYWDESLQYMQLSLENPLKQTCMNEEDLMGKTKKTASRTHSSTTHMRGLQRHYLEVRRRWRCLADGVPV